MLTPALIAYATQFALRAARIAGFTVVSPFPGTQVPETTRVGFVVVLTLATSSASMPQPTAIDLSFAMHAGGELAVGLLIGLTFRFVMSSADVLGGALAHATGLGAAHMFNPASGIQDTVLGQITSLLAILVALGAGIHRTVLAYLLASFDAIPVGKLAGVPATVPFFVELGGQAIATGTRLAMPVIALSLALQVVLAMLARAAPAMQIFNVGFPILILAGLWAFAASIGPVAAGLAQEIGGVGRLLDRLLMDLAGG